MAFKHPLDPQTQWDAAAKVGKLIAQGILAERDVLPDLIAAAAKSYTGEMHGLQARLTWRVRECADHWRTERDRAEFIIRRELASMLDAFEEGPFIIRSGHAVNERMGEPLLRREVLSIIEGEMSARMAVQTRAHTPQRRRRNVR